MIWARGNSRCRVTQYLDTGTRSISCRNPRSCGSSAEISTESYWHTRQRYHNQGCPKLKDFPGLSREEFFVCWFGLDILFASLQNFFTSFFDGLNGEPLYDVAGLKVAKEIVFWVSW